MFRLSLLGGALFLGGAVLPARAQDKADDGKLTTESLKSLLDDMGLQPKEIASKIFEVKVDRSDYTVYVRVAVATDGRLLYLWTRSGAMPRPADLPGAFWKRLLEENSRLSPAGRFWSYEKGSRRVVLSAYVPNHQITAATLRKDLNALHELAKEKDDIWRPKLPDFVPIADTPEQAKEREEFQGRWEAVEVTEAGKKMTADEYAKENNKGKKLAFTFEKQGGSAQFGEPEPFVFRIGPEPGQMSWYAHDNKKEFRALYKIEKDALVLCEDPNGLEFPPAFESTKKNGYTLYKFVRAK